MGRLKEIRENSPEWMKMSLMDLLEVMDPTLNNKYVQMLVNLLKSKMEDTIERIKKDDEIKAYSSEFHHRLTHFTDEFVESIPLEKLISYTRLCDISPFSYNDFKDISDFINRHMNNKFFSVDVNQIKTLKEIQSHNSIASIKEIEKEMENQVVVVLDNENWLAVRPITHESSLKYGATTKWCTASRDSYYHFFRYSESGKLVYIIDKKTGEKTAMFAGYSPQGNGYEISFWNQVDERVDSLMTNLDNEIMTVLRNIIKDDSGTNKELNPQMWLESKHREESKEMMSEKMSDRPRVIRTRVIEDPLPMEDTEDMGELTEERYVGREVAMEEREYEMNFEEMIGGEVMERVERATFNYRDHMDNRPMTSG